MQVLTPSAASNLPPASAPTATTATPAGRPWIACLLLAAPPADVCVGEDADNLDDRVLCACRRLTPRVERVSPWCLLLDLGLCTECAAQAAIQTLLRHLARLGVWGRAGIAPSPTLAQLAALQVTADQPLRLVTPDAVQPFLRSVPVSALLHLPPPSLVPPTSLALVETVKLVEIVARLERYGLRTLGHLARLGAPTLQRQFGPLGAFLAALAAGHDERPLQPTSLPAEYRARLRLASGAATGAAPERVLAALGPFTARVAAQLRAQGRQAQRLRVGVRWACGCTDAARLTLRQPTHDAAQLTPEVRRLLLSLLAVHGARAAAGAGAGHHGAHAQTLDRLWIALGDLTPVLPRQATFAIFWRPRDQRLAAMRLVAETLAQRHGRPLLRQCAPARPAAIFAEECHQLAALPATTSAAAQVRAVQHPRQQAAVSAAPLASAVSAVPPDPWQAVPHRLHWW